MTVTLTTQELYQFQEKLQEWYNRRSIYILDQFIHRPLNLGGFQETKPNWQDAARKFERENPKPDWRSLLAEVAAS